MRLIIITVCFLLTTIRTDAQNLIPDPYFEDRYCRQVPEYAWPNIQNLEIYRYWDNLMYETMGNKCPGSYKLNTSSPRMPKVIFGTNYGVGVVSHPWANKKDTNLQRMTYTQLNRACDKDKPYYFSMYFSMLPNSAFTTDSMKVLLHDHPEFGRYDADAHNLIPTEAYSLPSSTFLPINTGNWFRAENCFQPRGGEIALSIYVLTPHWEFPKSNDPFQDKFVKNELDIKPFLSYFVEQTWHRVHPLLTIALSYAVLEPIPPDTTIHLSYCNDDKERWFDPMAFGLPLYISATEASYKWDNGSRELKRQLLNEGSYRLRVELPCAHSEIELRVSERVCKESLFIPNAFTPNNDGFNDLFEVYGIAFELHSMQIFNRSGSMLFNCLASDCTWDGTFLGELLPPDTYVYSIGYWDIDGILRYKAGEIVLLR